MLDIRTGVYHEHVREGLIQIFDVSFTALVLVDDQAVWKGLQDLPLLLDKPLDLHVVHIGFLILLLLEIEYQTRANAIEKCHDLVCKDSILGYIRMYT